MDKHKLLFYSLNVRVFHIASGKVTPKPANAKGDDKSRVQSAKDEILSSGSRGTKLLFKNIESDGSLLLYTLLNVILWFSFQFLLKNDVTFWLQ